MAPRIHSTIWTNHRSSELAQRRNQTRKAEVMDIGADSYRLEEAKELTAARSRHRSKRPRSGAHRHR